MWPTPAAYFGAAAYLVLSTRHGRPHDQGPSARRKRRARLRNHYRRILRSRKMRGSAERRLYNRLLQTLTRKARS